MTREQALKVIKGAFETVKKAATSDNYEDKMSILNMFEAFSDKVDEAIKALSQEPCDDAISRKSVDRILRDMGVNCAYDMPRFWANKGKDYKVIPTKWHKGYQQAVADFEKRISELPPVTQKSEECKECKYFEYDSVAKVDGVPLIVAHEICNKWGNGCKTREDGYCFLFEPQESEDKE